MEQAGSTLSRPRTVAVLGATGSVGGSTLDVIARHPDRFRVGAVAARSNWQKLRDICVRFQPELAAVLEEDAALRLDRALRASASRTEVMSGPAGLAAVATFADADTVLAAIVGAAGLHPTTAAARMGRRILLANKEALVVGGEIFMAAAAAGNATLLPIDSEHNAIFQCLPPRYARNPRDFGVITLDPGPGWVVYGHHNDVLTYVGPDEVTDDSDLAVGLYGRGKRDRDGHELTAVHVEDKRAR